MYGIWIALFAGFTLLQVFDFGHQSYIGNLLNVEYHIDRKKFYNHLGSSLTIAILLGILQLTITIFLVITGYLNDFLGVSTGESNYYVISVSMLSLMLMWVIAGSIGGILIKILIPAGYMAQSITWGIIFKLSQFLSLLIVAINGGKILEASLVYSIVQLFLSYIVFKYIKISCPNFIPGGKSGILIRD
ncbi:MAG: hypothetical protein M5T52_04175 [Ignavibacteriaceae bacterium]|nr:hypothetical protein [Ignavibacteriaceae bacterium]